jgi:hypothetical protein
MKKMFFAFILAGAFSLNAQAQNSNTVWNAPKACEGVKAEQNASNNMSPGVKALYNASKDESGKIGQGALNIYCNPPSKPTPAPTTKPAATSSGVARTRQM